MGSCNLYHTMLVTTATKDPLHHYMFTIFHLLLISPLISTLFLLDTGTPGASRGEIINI